MTALYHFINPFSVFEYHKPLAEGFITHANKCVTSGFVNAEKTKTIRIHEFARIIQKKTVYESVDYTQ